MQPKDFILPAFVGALLAIAFASILAFAGVLLADTFAQHVLGWTL